MWPLLLPPAFKILFSFSLSIMLLLYEVAGGQEPISADKVRFSAVTSELQREREREKTPITVTLHLQATEKECVWVKAGMSLL